ncbi:extracellular solute-binding protein [Actinoplanes couchii]|uniref:Sugar ABC transporter substrate-binding protein n=1 Tax=Actinoplanes couchii TaxID=403638 RepID=A0ABQ3X3N1_9ACTN|nr:extracellular solute-binding protein [Actinoplanes couchii]MDR6322888.1 multiple sugar transport system substrate-binding protein [Actinoplanes couchii]GID53128.1 sugar ABC transporter substrate-binding protein [Actinoplanes couchii]
MAEVYSRRSFMVGTLSTGLLSSAAGYLLTRHEPVRLTLVTGGEPTGGGRNLLITLWNQLNPDIFIDAKIVPSTTYDQVEKFVATDADIYNLDLIHIPRFVVEERIEPITPRGDLSLLAPVQRVCQVDDGSGRLWAVPFNSDVGMLFRRIIDKRVADPEPELKDVLKLDGFIGQLATVGPQTDEAFVINVLEHALAQDPLILDQEGVLSTSLSQWQSALAPLADAMRSGRIKANPSEEDTIRQFRQENLRYMRNWPVWFPSVDREERARPTTAEIRLSRLPVGILGGQSLAISKDTRYREAAEKVIRFLTDTAAQKLLATYGFAPPGLDAYIDEELKVSQPHLDMVRNAINDSRPRPMHPRYPEFAQRFKEHTYAYLHRGEALTQRFAQDIQEVLKK